MRFKTFLRVSPVLYPFRFVGNVLLRQGECNRVIKTMSKEMPVGFEKFKLKADMMNEKAKRFFTFTEYFLFEFRNKSVKERKAYISDFERVHYIRCLNKIENEDLFKNKFNTYKKYREYYRREAEFVDKDSKEKFDSFADRHESFIIKPVGSSFGDGVQIFHGKPDFDGVIKGYPEGAIIEELIVQCKETEKYHPKSVNSVRVTTIRLDDRIETVCPFIRAGRGDSVVDNGGRGGIFCGIDQKSGTIIHTEDELGRHFDIHPDTGEKLVGSVVPRFDEALEFAKKLALVTPENRFTGWDLVLTDDGWVMMEGNCLGQFFFQMAHGGFREKLDGLFKEMNIKFEYDKRL